MKKFFKFALMAIAMMAVSAAMVSCGDDKDEVPTPSTPTKKVYATLEMDPLTDAKFNEMAHINVKYQISPAEGAKQTQENGYLNKKETIKDILCPCTIEVSYEYVAIEGAIQDDVTYTPTFGPKMSITVGDGVTVWTHGGPTTFNENSKLTGANFKKLYLGKEKTFTIKIDAEGNQIQ